MRPFVFFTLFFLFIIHAKAQDSVNVKKFSTSITERFAEARMFDFEYVSMSSRNIKPVLLGNKLSKMAISSNRGFRTSFNIPVLKGNKWRLTYSLLYNYQGMETTSFQDENLNKEVDLNYISSTASYTYFTSLFDKMVVFNGSFIVDGSQKNIERIKPMGSAIMVLKKDENVNMSIGLIAVIDPSSKIPVFPILTYARNLENNWRLDVIFPQRVLLQTRFLPNGRVSFGSQLSGSNFYIRSRNIVDFANKFEFRQAELRTGISYEYLLNKSIVLTAKGGMMNLLSSRLAERGKSFSDDDYLMNFKSGATGYINLGISFNPF